jgi:hypothetical protein
MRRLLRIVLLTTTAALGLPAWAQGIEPRLERDPLTEPSGPSRLSWPGQGGTGWATGPLPPHPYGPSSPIWHGIGPPPDRTCLLITHPLCPRPRSE